MNDVSRENSEGSGQARFRIRTPAGELEVVGSEKFVSEKWAEARSVITKIGEPVQEPMPQLQPPDESERDTSRRTTTRKRGGPSCGSRVLLLKESGFFTGARRASEVVEKLNELATPYEAKHVAAALNHLTKSGKLRRIKGPDGDWNYVNP